MTANEPFKSVLVALDLTEMDDALIRYAQRLSQVLPLERLFFVHVSQDLELPAELLQEYPGLLEPRDESIQGDIQQKVNHYFTGAALDIQCLVEEGNAIEKGTKDMQDQERRPDRYGTQEKPAGVGHRV